MKHRHAIPIPPLTVPAPFSVTIEKRKHCLYYGSTCLAIFPTRRQLQSYWEETDLSGLKLSNS